MKIYLTQGVGYDGFPMEWLFSWEVSSVVIALAVAVAFAFLSLSDFKLAKLFFLIAAADASGGMVMWGVKTQRPLWQMMSGVFVLMGAIGVVTVLAFRYVDRKQSKPNATFGSAGSQSSNALPAPVLTYPSSISKSSSFSTIVPVATLSLGRPVRRIPFDENINDPKADFYRDLGMLSQRPFENPPGITFQEKPLGDANVARIFLASLLQYYILRRIRELQRGTLAFSVTTLLGKEKPEAKAIDVPAVPVPDSVPYSIENLFRALEGNEFLNVYSYSKSTKDGVETPHWDQLERTYWESRERPFQVPSGTIISFSGNDHDPERNVRLERPGFYELKFSVVPLFGGKGALPENFYTSWPSVDSYSCRITMDYEIQQRTDGGFAPNLYVQWAEDLFAGMKRAMAP